MEKKIDELTEKLEKTESLLNTIVEKLDNRYSAKWVEAVLKWAGGIIGTALISSILALIIKMN